jgi:hypothetical protein
MTNLKEEVDGEFGPEYFGLKSRGGHDVSAKWMRGKDDRYIIDHSTGKPYMVPVEFDFETAMKPYRELNNQHAQFPMAPEDHQELAAKMGLLYLRAHHGGSLDLQRSWNGKSFSDKSGFVKEFTASANFVYGAAGAAMGFKKGIIIAAGGIYNKKNSILNGKVDASGDFGNNIANPPNIIRGFEYEAGSESLNFEVDHQVHINLSGSPVPSNNIHDRDRLSESIRNGRVTDHPTASFSLGSELLTKTDLASVLSANLATGGVRPGDIQLDPNPDISKALVSLNHFSEGFGLQNALGINALAINSIENVYVDPVLINLDGKGIALAGINEGVAADFDNSGLMKRTGWFKPGTGMLVQPNAQGEVRSSAQWVSEYLGGTIGGGGQAGEKLFNTSFEALKSLDGNSDGHINHQDEAWATLRIWEDSDSNGKAAAYELKSLEATGITSIDLVSYTMASDQVEGNLLTGKLNVAKDGAIFEAATVDFLGDPIGGMVSEVSEGLKVQSTGKDGTVKALLSTADTGAVLDAGALGVANLYGSKGDDVLTARPSGSWLVGGAGSNTYNGSSADDVFVISAWRSQ